MEIRFVSSLTAEDEGVFAPALLKALGALLDQMPIAYTLRIETSGAQVFQHTHAGSAATLPASSADLAGQGGRIAALAGFPTGTLLAARRVNGSGRGD